ncbi:MAG: hypothetical protein ABIE43_03920 [Patescibacteria group bacterium]
MNLLITGLFQFIGVIIIIVYGVVTIKQIRKRVQNLNSVDQKMLTVGRIMTWGAVIAIIVIGRNSSSSYYLIFLSLSLVVYILGSRLYVLSYNVKEENINSSYDNLDQWLETKYKKYLAPLWKNKE